MTQAQTTALVSEALGQLFTGRPGDAVELLAKHKDAVESRPQLLGLLRLAIHRPAQNLLYYLKLLNLWNSLERPALKPNPVQRKVRLLTDYTADNLAPLLTLFAGAFGIHAEVEVSAFDSAEQLILDPQSPLQLTGSHVAVLSLSEHWLKRYLGKRALVAAEDIGRVKELLTRLVQGVQSRGPACVLLTNFAGKAYPLPGGSASHGTLRGWERTVAHLNDWLGTLTGKDVHLIDLAEALFSAGGRSAVGRVSYLRSKMVFETAGTIAAARALAGGIAHASGKTHRALITDWDNTLWGGEVAEAGSHGIVCGLDSPDALAYTLVQEHLQALTSLGVLLAAVSRNDPRVASVFEENPEVRLKLDDFASVQVGFTPKSESVARVCKDLGFGSEFAVFLDDSLFELAEVFSAHPHIDLLQAGPDPEATLRGLSDSRFFNALSLSEEDLLRGRAAQSLRKQRDLQTSFGNLEDFLRSIHIKLDVAGLGEKNLPRVLQMFQKSNQFNLTTRRHGDGELRCMQEDGAVVGVFSYEDVFGPQGVVSVVVLFPEAAAMRVESWLMSCRVLNRTVEQAVFAWVAEQAAGRVVVGEYIPTEKNGLVRDLYQRLGFRLASCDPAGKQTWIYDEVSRRQPPPAHFAETRRVA